MTDMNAPSAAFPRRHERVGFELPVRCKCGLVRSTVMLKDLTPGGARIAGLELLRVGEAITLFLPGIAPRMAFVMWSQPMATGVEFDMPLSPEVFEALVRDFAIGHLQPATAAISTAPVVPAAGRPVRHAA